MQMNLIIMILVALTLVMETIPASAEEKAIEIISEGSVLVGDDITMGQAKAAALNNARRTALEKTLGVEVHGSTTVYNFQLINDLVVTATRGLIIKEKIVENKCRTRDEQISCLAKIEATVKPLNRERGGNFTVTQLSVHRPDRQEDVKSPVFNCSDEIHVHAAANQDAYMHIFSVDQIGNISQLYPNSYCTFEKTLAEKEIVFPDESQRKSGLKMKVRTPKGVKKAVESVLVIATKEKVDFLKSKDIENPTITDLMRELSELDPSLWAEKTAGYEVRE
jgi:hypothetical protein